MIGLGSSVGNFGGGAVVFNHWDRAAAGGWGKVRFRWKLLEALGGAGYNRFSSR